LYMVWKRREKKLLENWFNDASYDFWPRVLNTIL
jgi:hypothetical protein